MAGCSDKSCQKNVERLPKLIWSVFGTVVVVVLAVGAVGFTKSSENEKEIAVQVTRQEQADKERDQFREEMRDLKILIQEGFKEVAKEIKANGATSRDPN